MLTIVPNPPTHLVLDEHCPHHDPARVCAEWEKSEEWGRRLLQELGLDTHQQTHEAA